MTRRSFVFSLFLLCVATPSFSQVDDIYRRLELGSQTLSDTKISSGLKEALQVGTDNAVRLTGQRDGYFRNEAIKILMPKNLSLIEKGLRAVGYGPKMDAFVLSMNRAAEAAAPAARKIFVNAILSITFDDARKILSGGNTAATDYFRARTTDQLTAAFRPIVEKTMNQNSVTQQYTQLIGQAQAIPFVKTQNLDITNYVVAQALNGLFYVLGQQEQEIRKNPVARTTDLLKQVFGKQ